MQRPCYCLSCQTVLVRWPSSATTLGDNSLSPNSATTCAPPFICHVTCIMKHFNGREWFGMMCIDFRNALVCTRVGGHSGWTRTSPRWLISNGGFAVSLVRGHKCPIKWAAHQPTSVRLDQSSGSAPAVLAVGSPRPIISPMCVLVIADTPACTTHGLYGKKRAMHALSQ